MNFKFLLFIGLSLFAIKANAQNTFTDTRDGNTYKTTAIGNQLWMAENLRFLPSVTRPGTGSQTLPYYYVLGYDSTDVNTAKTLDNYNTFGVLYNWVAAMAGSASSSSNPSEVQGACPTGWHLPSEAEWNQLTTYLGGISVAGGKLKETETTHWATPNAGATDEYNFTALPGLWRDTDGSFSRYVGNYGSWWTSTQTYPNIAKDFELFSSGAYSGIGNPNKETAFSVRCLSNNPQSRINENNQENSLQIYPNPANTFVIIKTGNSETRTNYTLRIENLLGQQVYQTVTNQPEFQIEVNNLGGTGTYIVKIIDHKSNVVATKKIVLQ